MLAAGSVLDPLYTAFGWLLAFFYTPFHSLGLSIILLTITVMLVQFPLIQKQTRSMIQMQRVQPEIKKIQQKYKDDRQKQNEELLKFYQENQINPLAGCLPLVIIFPIGIAVFRTFRNGIQRHLPRSGVFDRLYVDLCGSAHTSTKVCGNYLSGKGADGKGTHQIPHTLYFLGINLNWAASEVRTKLSGHALQWTPYYALIGLVILTGWYQVRQTQARQLRQGGAPPNQQMQMITRVMPVFFGVITYGLNAATTLYFVVSNLWRIGQQHFVLNKMYEEAVEAGDIKPPPPKDGPKNGPGPKPGASPARPKGPAPRTGDGGAEARPPQRPSANTNRRKRKRKR